MCGEVERTLPIRFPSAGIYAERRSHARLTNFAVANPLKSKQIPVSGSAPTQRKLVFDLYPENVMNRVIRQLSKDSSVTPGRAADQIDKVVHRLLQKLRKGEDAPLPGVGVITPGPTPKFIEEIHVNVPASGNRRKRS
jgi:hypothetical protein